MWRVTCDTSYVTPEMWHMVGVNILSKFQLPSSFGLGGKVIWRSGGKGLVTRLIDHVINQRRNCSQNSPGYTGSVKNLIHIVHPPWILKRVGLESSGRIPSSLYWKTKRIAFFFFFFGKNFFLNFFLDFLNFFWIFWIFFWIFWIFWDFLRFFDVFLFFLIFLFFWDFFQSY